MDEMKQCLWAGRVGLHGRNGTGSAGRTGWTPWAGQDGPREQDGIGPVDRTDPTGGERWDGLRDWGRTERATGGMGLDRTVSVGGVG